MDEAADELVAKHCKHEALDAHDAGRHLRSSEGDFGFKAPHVQSQAPTSRKRPRPPGLLEPEGEDKEVGSRYGSSSPSARP